MPINPKTGKDGPGQAILAEDGVLGGGHHRYLSAVATLHKHTHAADYRSRWHEERRAQFQQFEDRIERGTAAAAAAMADPEYLEAERFHPGHYFTFRVVATPGTLTGEAVPLDPNLFDGQDDEYHEIDQETGQMKQIR
ncbi:MAG: hypothetical protein U0R71_01075 [Solirubrobacterales bacterium]